MSEETTNLELEAVEPVALPWLEPAVELEALATTAQIEKWSDEDLARATQLLTEITNLMSSSAPVEPPTIPPEPVKPDLPIVDDTGKLQRVKYPPGAARTLTATAATLLDVVNNKAQPGDHVVCEGSGYDREYVFTKAFPPDKKVVIRSKVPLEANFQKPIQFKAPGYWLHECRSSFDTRAVPAIYLDASHVFLTRNWLQGPDAIFGAKKALSNIQIGWNRLTGQNKGTGASSHIFIWLPTSGNYTKAADGPRLMSIHYNYLQDKVSKAAEAHNIYFGHTKAGPKDLPMMEDVYIDFNLIAPDDQRTRSMYLKRGCVVRRNSDLSTNRNFGVRHGLASKVWANIIRSSYFHFGGAMVTGGTPQAYHDIRGNEAPNADLILWCGSETAAPYQAASYAMATGNKVRSIRVGVRQGQQVSAAQGGLTKGVRVFLDGKLPRSKVSLESCVKDTITIRDDDGGIVIPKTFPLTEEMVGLETKKQGG